MLIIGLGIGAAVAIGVGLADEVGVAAGVGFAADLIATPLFQASRLPDFMQVNFLPPETAVAPAFAHVVPGFMPAALSGPAKRAKRSTKTITGKELFFMM